MEYTQSAITEIASNNIENYGRINNDNVIANNAIHNAIRSNLEFRTQLTASRVRELTSKQSEASAQIAEIHKGYSFTDIKKGNFSKKDAALLKKYHEQVGQLTSQITSEQKRHQEFETAVKTIYLGIEDIRTLAENSIMFGLPKNPHPQEGENTQSRDELDFTNTTDAIYNYNRQQAFAQDLATFAGLVGTKKAKQFAEVFYQETSKAKTKTSEGMHSKQDEVSALLKRFGLDSLPIDDYHYSSDNSKSKPTVNQLFDSFMRNSSQISRIATHSIVSSALIWPEDDKKALREKQKEPDYSHQVCQTIDRILFAIGGIEGIEIPEETIAKLEKMKAPYIKQIHKLAKKSPNQNTPTTMQQQDTPTQTANTSEPSQEQELAQDTPDIDPSAYEHYNTYSHSGSPLSFESWCQEKGIEVPRGWQHIAEERDKGREEYARQQAEKANSETKVIDPQAYAYYDAYSNSATGKSFESWCQEKGIEVPRGWQHIAEERDKGREEYNKQQTEPVAETKVVDPLAYGYYDAYSHSGSPLSFESWCQEKGVETPRGWQHIAEEQDKGREEYNKQQTQPTHQPNPAEMEDDGMGM